MEAVRNIGKIVFDRMNKNGLGLLEVFTEDVSGNGAYKHCLEIVIELFSGIYSYKEINLRQYDSELKYKYLYRSGSSRGTDLTPTAKVTTISKTFNNKIVKAFPEAINFGRSKYEEEKKYLSGIYNVLIEKGKYIERDLTEKIKNIPKKEKAFISVLLEIDGYKKYIGDFELFRDKIVMDALKKFRYSETYKKDVYKDRAVCSLCRKKTIDIYGLVGTFPFFTIDKPGYISSGFNYEKAWRNYPVCKQCAIELELGKNYLDQYLSYSFYGRRYYIIPKPIYSKDLSNVLNKYIVLNSENIRDIKEKYSAVEEKVFRFLSKEENTISFDLMFIESKNAALNILLNIEDVAPSRFTKIYDAMDEIRSMNFFQNKPVNFEILNLIFQKDKYNRYFLDTIDKIISDTKIDYNFLMRFFNEYIMEAFKRFEKDEYIKDKDSYYYATFRVFGFLYFMEFLNLFRRRKGEVLMKIENKIWDIKDYDNKKAMYQAFFNAAQPFFNSPDKKAVFMVGYITRRLLNIQLKKEQRKPFLSRLKGLKLNSKDIKRLIPEIQAKLIEYKSAYYDDELDMLSQFIIDSNGLKALSDLDIPFYFSLGMNMVPNFNLSNKKDDDCK